MLKKVKNFHFLGSPRSPQHVFMKQLQSHSHLRNRYLLILQTRFESWEIDDTANVNNHGTFTHSAVSNLFYYVNRYRVLQIKQLFVLYQSALERVQYLLFPPIMETSKIIWRFNNHQTTSTTPNYMVKSIAFRLFHEILIFAVH